LEGARTLRGRAPSPDRRTSLDRIAGFPPDGPPARWESSRRKPRPRLPPCGRLTSSHAGTW
jgi:hypothetical protein